MRLLHTSDWHLGADFAQFTRHPEHERFLDWLLAVLVERQVDVLVVAGDVFDTANPPAEALRLYYGFLARLALTAPRLTVLVVGGNHDSPSRLDAPRDVLQALRAHVVGGHAPEREGHPHGDASGLLVPLADAAGEVGLVAAAVPFLNDWRLGVRGFDGTADEQRRSLHEAFRGVYARLAERAAAAWPGVPLVATGHLTCLPNAGDAPRDDEAAPCEINRVGTLGALGPDVFDQRYRYVALGHLHRAFPVGDGERIWYAGTPVSVSVTEPWASRRVLLVDVDARGARVERLPVPVARRLVRVAGGVDEVRAGLAALQWGDGELPPYVVVEASLRAEQLERQLSDELRTHLPDGPGGRATLVELRVTRLRLEGASGTQDRELPTGEDLTPEDAFRFAWRTEYGDAAVPDEPVLQRFQSLLETPVDAP